LETKKNLGDLLLVKETNKLGAVQQICDLYGSGALPGP
jgi:hypothetical protein